MAGEGRNLSQEVDELRAKIDAIFEQGNEFKKLLTDVVNKAGGHTGAGHPETSNANPGEIPPHVDYPPGYEPHFGDGYNAQSWNIGANTMGAGENRQLNQSGSFADDVMRNLEKMVLKEELEEKMQEQFRAMQGPSPYGPMKIKELCLTPDVTVPKDFKMPEFVKFDGSSNPMMHLKMYCTKMGMWSKDENFLMGLFPESLDGAAWEWYMQLDMSKIKRWEDLAMAFVTQYKFNLNAAPTRDQLKGMKKKVNEPFKEYAQRWRIVAARVVPPMTESEMCSYFIRTLEGPFFKNMLGTHVKEFADLVEIGERIEANIQEGRIELAAAAESSEPKKGSLQKKKESGVNAIQPSYPSPRSTFRPRYNPSYQYPPYQRPTPYSYPPQPHQVNNIPYPRPHILAMPRPRHITQPNYQPIQTHAFTPQTHPGPNVTPNTRGPIDTRPFPDFHMSKNDLFNRLREKNLIAPCYARPMVPPYPRWYNPNVTCEYHSNAPGHSLEDCFGFKQAVWRLLDNKLIEIQTEADPNIKDNPFPNYDTRQVNALEGDDCVENDTENAKISMKTVLEGLRAAGYEVVAEGKNNGRILTGNENDLCCRHHGSEKEHSVEDCPDFKLFVQKMVKLGILQVSERTKPEEKDASMIQSEPLVFKVPARKPVLVFRTPSPFPYDTDHAVPWRYDVVIETPTEPEPSTETTGIVTNVVGVGGVTRSGRCYSPDQNQRIAKANPIEKPKEKNPEDEEGEFLKIMKQSEFDVVEQLKRTPAKISLFSLIMTSEAHRNALKRVLDQAYVHKDITPENVESIVNAIKAANVITFAESEIAPSASRRPRALHITIKCHGYIVAKVLIDGGSALNVLPYSTLQQLCIEHSTIEPSTMIVRAFDGTRREIMGNISLQLEIGPSMFMTEFQVMEIEPAYTMLLGRPWIHEAGAVPSTVHQRVKYITDGKVVTVKAEEELLITKPVSVPYVDNAENSIESSFQSLEIAGMEKNTGSINQVAARMMYQKGYQKGKGLGARLQGIKNPISLPTNPGKFGLGYEVSEKEHFEEFNELKIPHIRETFSVPADVLKPDHGSITGSVYALEDLEERPWLIRPSYAGEELNNWESETLLDLMYFE